MGRSKSVNLSSLNFDNQSQAKTFFKAMLNRYIPGEKISSEDSMHLRSLFERHPDYKVMIGVGISHFEVMPADYGTQCFCVIRTDGSKEGFSYIKCVTQKVK
jgi:Protein of unknown function (DUF3223)